MITINTIAILMIEYFNLFILQWCKKIEINFLFHKTPKLSVEIYYLKQLKGL